MFASAASRLKFAVCYLLVKIVGLLSDCPYRKPIATIFSAPNGNPLSCRAILHKLSQLLSDIYRIEVPRQSQRESSTNLCKPSRA
jgi:hypothetical protein